MEQVIVDTSALRLPREFAKKIGTGRVIIREVDEGILLTPIPKQTRKIRGMPKGTGFSTERCFEQKAAERLAEFRKLTGEIHELNQTEPLPPEYDEMLKKRVNFSRNLDL